MAISRIGVASAATTSVTLPTHQAGDLILIFAFRDNGATSPSLPAGYTAFTNSGASGVSQRVGYKFAASSSETSGAWTNATEVHAHVYRGTNSSTPLGGVSNATNSTTSVSYAAMTMTVTDGTSWIAALGANQSTTNAIATAPAGMGNRTDSVAAASESATHDTNGGVSSWSAQTVAIASAVRWRTVVVEIIAAATSTTVSVTAGSITENGQAITVNAKTDVTVPAGAIIFAGQAIIMNAQEIVAAIAGTISFLGRAISATGGSSIVSAIFSRGLKLILGMGV